MLKFCMGCMKQYDDEYEICPYCGYVEGTKPEQALHMEPGSILQERYIVGRTIGYGGFGVTYIGWDAVLERKVAIKEYLPSEFSTRMPGVTQVSIYSGDKNEQFNAGLQRFLEESRKLAKVNNVSGIVKIYDSFEENNTAYIIMEYLEGETLAERLMRDKTICPEEAITMLIPVMESLKKVHELGIIHRDIAPDNLFITQDGRVKVIDFGAARFATTSHSRSLTVIIKPGYSSEEQYRSRSDQGAYTDVYAIAATLYKMITGVTPPDALERYAMAEGKRKDILKPISGYKKDIDPNIENAVLNAMNIRIEDRTQDMETFLEELQSEEPVKRVYGKIKKLTTFRWPRWLKVVMSLSSLAVAVLSILFVTGVIGFESGLHTEIEIPEGMTRVPSIVNNEKKKAEKRLEEAILLYTITGKEYSANIPKDYILTQDLAGGILVTQNSVVNVTVSGGAEEAEVPDVTNFPLEEAVKLIEEAGFQVELKEEYSNAIKENYIISQSEKGGSSIEFGSVIKLVVSKGRDPEAALEDKEIKLPEMIGKTYQKVLLIAENNGFMITVSERRYSSKYPAGTVMEQNPAAGTSIHTGSEVTLVISLGKNSVKVPDVQYRQKEEAKSALERVGLKVRIEEAQSETVAAGLVIKQTPKAGAEVDPGAVVTITVSKGGASFAMPGVVGMTEAKAKTTLLGKGLSVTVNYEYSKSKSGTVLRQSIPENAKVKRGTNITITVSSGEEPVSVPNVIGKTSADAQKVIREKGLSVTINQIYSDTVAEGKVISQTPASGSSLVKGSTVVITVSLGKDTVTSISVASKPNKTSYFAGETLNTSGMVLTAAHKSGKTETVTSGYSCSPTSLNTPGNQTITVNYQEETASFTVSVKAVILNSISVLTLPTKTSYNVGDTLNTNGLSLKATYNNGNTETITSSYTCSPTTLNIVGTQTIKITYKGKNTSFNVTVTKVEDTTKTEATLIADMDVVNTNASAINPGSVTIKNGGKLIINFTARLPEPYVQGSHKYTIWGGIFNASSWSWIDTGSYYLDGGTIKATYIMDTSKCYLPNGRYQISLGIFLSDNFVTGESLHNAYGEVILK